MPALTMTLQRFSSPLEAGTTRCRFAGGFLLCVWFCLDLGTSMGSVYPVVALMSGPEDGYQDVVSSARVSMYKATHL